MRISTPARILGAAALTLAMAAPVVAAPSAPRAAVGTVKIGDVHFRPLSARIIPDSTGMLDLLIATSSDAISYEVTGYVQRTRSKSNDLRLSLARAKAVRAYLRHHGVSVAIHIHGARVPRVHPGRWDARRATIQVVRSITPVLTGQITTAWGTPSADEVDFGITGMGTWSNSPDAFEYKWQYKFNTMSDWADIVDGTNEMGTLHSYSTETATSDQVVMTRTSVYNYLQACGIVRGFVRAQKNGDWSDWYETQWLMPQGCVA
jgi:hypothetical protein